MSQLESCAKALIPALAEGKAASVLREDAVHLAAWLVKTMMTTEFAGPNADPFFTAGEREHVRLHLTPPPETAVSLGIATDVPYAVFSFSGDGHSEEQEVHLGFQPHRYTLVIKRLVMHVVTVKFSPSPPPEPITVFSGKPGAHMRLWPWPTRDTHQPWPPTVHWFGPGDFAEMMKRHGFLQ